MNGERIGRAEMRELRGQLSDRDLAILRQVGDLRLMSGGQIEAVHFGPERHATAETSARVCRRALKRLVHERLLVRLTRRVGGLRAGSQTFIYGLGPVGHRLLQQEDSRLRPDESSRAFVDHQLAVSQLVADLILASRLGQFELLAVEGEPRCWRTVPTYGRVILRPDLFVAVGVDALEFRWFIEVDRGTHRNPALLRKAQLYESYYRSGVEQTNHDVFPRVIWITPDDARAEAIQKVITGSEFTSGLMQAIAAAKALRVLAGASS
jgi:hypothetical protein